MSQEKQNYEQTLAREFLDFVNASPSAFHAVDTSIQMLKKAGFQKLSELKDEDFKNLKPKGRYYFTRNQSTVFAFVVGGKYQPGNGFAISAAHTDSPCLKVKPLSIRNKAGYLQVGVEVYGGGLWHTWFDRDLSVAGRVIVADENNSKFNARLVRINRPIMRIPSLAIHLNREVNDKGFEFNKENHLLPMLATAVKASLTQEEKSDQESRHQPLLMKMLSEELQVPVERIRDFELSLYDTQPSALGGALNEFIFSARLDNLMMSFCSIRALLKSLEDPKSIDNESTVRLVALFDNEEVGSESDRGAASNMMVSALKRIAGEEVNITNVIRKSYLVSADMAHALHPNYSEKHEENHRPHMHKGLVIKHNANQRYATTSVTAFMLRELARRHNIPVQDFCVRNDSVCGSTIGPILSANCGMRTVDVGIPQLSMHSIREVCGTGDVALATDLLTHFFHEFSALDATVSFE